MIIGCMHACMGMEMGWPCPIRLHKCVRARASPSHLPAENDLKGHEMESKPPKLPIKYSLSLSLAHLYYHLRFNHISLSCLGSTTTLWVFEVLNCPISIFLYQYIYSKGKGKIIVHGNSNF